MTDYVKKVTDRLGIKKSNLAELLGVTKITIGNWQGKIPHQQLPKVCKLTGFMPWELSDDYDLEAIKRAKDYFEGL